MIELRRALVAGIAVAGLATAVVIGQPAIADQVDKAAAKNSVTSKSDKNSKIETKAPEIGIDNAIGAGETGTDDISTQSGVATLDFASMPAGACDTQTVATVSPALDPGSVVVTPSNAWPDGLVLTATSATGSGGSMDVVACNTTGGTLNPVSDSFGWAVTDN